MIAQLLSDLSHEVNQDPQYVLKYVQTVHAFLLKRQSFNDYQEPKLEVLQKAEQKREQDHGYEGPFF